MRLKEKIINSILFLSAFFSVIIIFLIIFFILREGAPIFIKEGLRFIFGKEWRPEGEIYGFPPSYGALPLILATLLTTFMSILIAVPLGVGSAIFISHLAPNRIKSFIKSMIEILAGIPSVVYGLFGMVVLVNFFQAKFGVASGEGWLSASIVLAIMILPTITSISEDVISSVPSEYIEGSFALGATKWQTIRKIILPASLPGIIASIVLGIGRAAGETMAVMMVIGNSALMPNLKMPFMPLKTITSAMAVEMGESPTNSMWHHALYGLAVILLLIALVVNWFATRIIERNKKRWKFIEKSKYAKIFFAFAISLLIIYIFEIYSIAIFAIVILIYIIARKGFISEKISQKIAFSAVTTCAIISVSFLFIILYYIFSKGIRGLSIEFLTQPPRNLGREGGIFPAIIGTLLLVGGAILFAMPLGIGAGIYLNEYAREGKIKKMILSSIAMLNGTPSIVFGLFGLTFFVMYLKWGISLLAGQVTLALMILPTIIKTTQETLKTIPRHVREGSFALGATKWQTIKKIVLPASLPGIMTGAILGIGRAAGETAPILFTAAVFSQKFLPTSVFQPVMALPYHLFIVITSVPGEEARRNAFATAIVLTLIVIILYMGAIIIRNRYRKKIRW
ncbi:MAG: phosphate ABC transporter permease PstA [Thermoplasmatales archaeon]|nr:phosphate ABC transporter permease PstA [Thermoplasmatales archaeon]